ncbi:hypothetical protein QYE76_060441 [Lolium multiflorum]|uniref:Uncharacterized protein n=1 Tax=Lolium multiflorum TaxID=4521 RepID=A0AAD8S192_LOLMU|nr:hypothetical protein QYE76_060435 [Lolium multiflorum]KAK1642636.1 hypothetical protein QYE76_060441 [Lolium multiflorum]
MELLRRAPTAPSAAAGPTASSPGASVPPLASTKVTSSAASSSSLLLPPGFSSPAPAAPEKGIQIGICPAQDLLPSPVRRPIVCSSSMVPETLSRGSPRALRLFIDLLAQRFPPPALMLRALMAVAGDALPRLRLLPPPAGSHPQLWRAARPWSIRLRLPMLRCLSWSWRLPGFRSVRSIGGGSSALLTLIQGISIQAILTYLRTFKERRGGTRNPIRCRYCFKLGHTEKVCRRRLRDIRDRAYQLLPP